MSNITKKHRQQAIIEDVRGPEDDDHGGMTVWIFLHFTDGGTQGFGGLIGMTLAQCNDYIHDVCAAFNVSKLEDLIGKPCFGLYNFGTYSDPIEGIESFETGKRFLNITWRRKHWPQHVQSRLADKQTALENEIQWATERMNNAQTQLQLLPQQYVDWEAEK